MPMLNLPSVKNLGFTENVCLGNTLDATLASFSVFFLSF